MTDADDAPRAFPVVWIVQESDFHRAEELTPGMTEEFSAHWESGAPEYLMEEGPDRVDFETARNWGLNRCDVVVLRLNGDDFFSLGPARPAWLDLTHDWPGSVAAARAIADKA